MVKTLEQITEWEEIRDYYYKKYSENKAFRIYMKLVLYFSNECDKAVSESLIEKYNIGFSKTLKYFKQIENDKN